VQRTWRLRVAIVAESFHPSVNGVARSVSMASAHLRRRGHEVLIVAPAPGPELVDGATVVRVPSVPLPLCPDLPLGLPTPALRTALERFAPDVVHLASPAMLGARAAVVARDLGIPTVAVYQTDLAGFARQYHLRPAARPLWRYLRRVHEHVDRTLAPSRHAVAELRAHGITDVHRWARGVDSAAFAPVHRTRPPTTEVARCRIGYVGRLATEKRVDRLRALADLPRTELVVVGDGPDAARLRRQLPMARFTGTLRAEALSRAYADLDVFVHTGVNETFCQALQEAMASGVAAVAPAVGGPTDLVAPGATGLLWEPGDPGSLRDAVRRLVEDPTRRGALAAAGRDSVVGRSWVRIGDELLAHYRAVLTPSGRPHRAAA
jgi:phosphatidylinositol alpha 1,6-mannosyltransferase